MRTDASEPAEPTTRQEDDICRAYEVDGEIVRVHGGRPLDETGQAALGEIVRAASAKVAAEHPNLGVIQELIMAGLAANRAISDGEVRGGCTIQDGAKVKARLKAAIGAAREALSTEQLPGGESLMQNGDPALQVPELYWSPTRGLYRMVQGLVGEWGHSLSDAPLPSDAVRLRMETVLPPDVSRTVLQLGRDRAKLAAERDERQARIEAALALMDYWDAHGGSIPQGHRLRALLRGDQQPAEEPKTVERVPCGNPDKHCGRLGGSAHCGGCRDDEPAPLSGFALRDVEERDDAAGDLP